MHPPPAHGGRRPVHRIRSATPDDVPLILDFIRALAEYERLLHEVVATEERLRETLFGETPAAEVLLAEVRSGDGEAVGEESGSGAGGWEAAGFALFFPTYSTFLALPGIHLEDLFVHPEHRGRGIGRALLARLAALVLERRWGRLEWAVLDWNEPAIGFYRSLGARPLDDWTTFRVTGEALNALASGDDART